MSKYKLTFQVLARVSNSLQAGLLLLGQILTVLQQKVLGSFQDRLIYLFGFPELVETHPIDDSEVIADQVELVKDNRRLGNPYG